MIGTKEWKKQNGDTTVSVKNRNNDPEFSHNPCGSCNACHTMTRIHPVTDSPIFGGSGDGNQGPNLQRPCAVNFFQRNLGNSYLQSIAESRVTSRQATPRIAAPTIQRKCACGGSCASCADKEEEIQKIQTKLTIGPANDVYEQEADRVAEQIMRMPDSSPQAESAGIHIQRIAADGDDTINSAPDVKLDQSGGQPFSPETRQFMEPRFGADFSHVRLHTGQEAHQTASQIRARAFTYGHDIWLGKGESESDRTLMAHELTHVVQQGATTKVGANGIENYSGVYKIQRDGKKKCPDGIKTIDVYAVNLPGSTRSIYDDIGQANSVWSQCCVRINITGGESWDTDLLDIDAPLGILNAPAGTIRPLTAEENAMVAHKPGGDSVIHAYNVPDFSGPKVAEAFWPSQHGERVVVVGDGARVDSFAHEIGHVLFDSGSHKDDDPDNLMASGSIRNAGVDKLEPDQCARI